MNNNFSVLMAVYFKDDPILFNKAILSILNNSILPDKFIIVADGILTNELIDIIKFHSNNKIIFFIQLPKNIGLANALNIGLKNIDTKYTIRADSDDYNHSNRFELLLNKLSEGYDLVGSYIREVNLDGTHMSIRSVPTSMHNILKLISYRNPFNHMTVGFLTDKVVEVGGYPNIYLKEDYALWARLISNGSMVCNLENILVDANTGDALFRRRGGFKYAYSEIKLQYFLYKCGFKSFIFALLHFIIRSIIFLSPNKFRKFFYLKFLRK